MGPKEWVFNVALKKAMGKAATSAVASLAVLVPILKQWGVDVSFDQAALAAAISAGAYGAYEFARNWLKQRKNIKLP